MQVQKVFQLVVLMMLLFACDKKEIVDNSIFTVRNFYETPHGEVILYRSMLHSTEEDGPSFICFKDDKQMIDFFYSEGVNRITINRKEFSYSNESKIYFIHSSKLELLKGVKWKSKLKDLESLKTDKAEVLKLVESFVERVKNRP